MSSPLRPFRSAALAVSAMMLFPAAANANVKDPGTLIEYAGYVPGQIRVLEHMLMSLMGMHF